jgi:hypothetical protein
MNLGWFGKLMERRMDERIKRDERDWYVLDS